MSKTFKKAPIKKPEPRYKIVMKEGPPRYFRINYRCPNTTEVSMKADRIAGKGNWLKIYEGSKLFVKRPPK